MVVKFLKFESDPCFGKNFSQIEQCQECWIKNSCFIRFRNFNNHKNNNNSKKAKQNKRNKGRKQIAYKKK